MLLFIRGSSKKGRAIPDEQRTVGRTAIYIYAKMAERNPLEMVVYTAWRSILFNWKRCFIKTDGFRCAIVKSYYFRKARLNNKSGGLDLSTINR